MPAITKTLAGVDFTSAPSRKKPITVAVGRLTHGCLKVVELINLHDWPGFEVFLAAPAVAGLPCQLIALDFPFSLPHDFLRASAWPTNWSEVMQRLSQLSKPQFEAWITDFCALQPVGHKYYYRPTDRLTQSSSPMKLFYPPVGKMLFQGATRLYQAHHLRIMPFHRHQVHSHQESVTHCIEAYPALVARYLLGKKKAYKSENRHDDTSLNRQQALENLLMPNRMAAYQVKQILLSDTHQAACLQDASGDTLDAVFCLVQAAWACQQNDLGIPDTPDAQQGWIVDPGQYLATGPTC